MDKGYFIEPTVFTGVYPPHMKIVQDRKSFSGPCRLGAPPIATRKTRPARPTIRPTGFRAPSYTADPERGYQMARRVRTGSMTINGMIVDP